MSNNEIKLHTSELDAASLRAGDRVLLSGTIINARDAAHKLIYDAINAGDTPPIDIKGKIVYYMGPSPKKPGHIIGAAGPTTAGRMDKYTPLMLDLGMKAMIGKGYRTKEVVDAIKKHKSAYFIAIGGAGSLISSCIKRYEVIAFADLGPEAISELEIVDLPLIVGIDSTGGNYYEMGQKEYLRVKNS